MARVVAQASARAGAPRDVVWQVLAEARRYHEWGSWQTTVLDEEGDPAPDGVGAVRRFTRRPVTSVERVELFEPPERFGYELLSGLPLRDYHAVVSLNHADDGGTAIHWRSEFEPKLRGTGRFYKRFVTTVIGQVAKQIAAEADRRRGVAQP
ncbi:MAG: hypothetical protein QOJ07_2699 [Thermoleophilaceae bacterium]|nr:hypothetical protein [Thermoleophilaceae bacterium]